MKSARISTDLGDPKLLRLLKFEADRTQSTQREVLVHALESYFAHRLETQAVGRWSEEVFKDWDNALDSEYDHL